MIKKIKERLKEHLDEVVRIKTSPHSVALGFAIGTAIAILPTFGLGIFIGLLVIFLFKKVSKVSMLAAFVVWNPIVLVPLGGLSYKVGDLILSGAPKYTFRLEFLNQVYLYSRRFLVGNLIVTAFFSITSYFVVYKLYRDYIKKKLI